MQADLATACHRTRRTATVSRGQWCNTTLETNTCVLKIGTKCRKINTTHSPRALLQGRARGVAIPYPGSSLPGVCAIVVSVGSVHKALEMQASITTKRAKSRAKPMHHSVPAWSPPARNLNISSECLPSGLGLRPLRPCMLARPAVRRVRVVETMHARTPGCRASRLSSVKVVERHGCRASGLSSVKVVDRQGCRASRLSSPYSGRV